MSFRLFEGNWERQGLGTIELNEEAIFLWACMLIDQIQITQPDDTSEASNKFTLTGVRVEYVLACRDVVEDLISGDFEVRNIASFSVSPEATPAKNIAVGLITLSESESKYAITKRLISQYWSQFLREPDMTSMTYLRAEAIKINGLCHIYYLYDNINYLYPFFEIINRSVGYPMVPSIMCSI